MIILLLQACDATDPTSDKPEEDDDPPTDPCAPDEEVGEPMTCETTVPRCGGDLVGTWAVTDWCGDESSTSGTTYTSYYCDGDTWRTSIAWDAFLAFSEDQTLTISTTVDAQVDWEVPPECLATYEIEDCAELSEGTFECTERADGGCDCVANANLVFSAESTWSTCGGVLTIPVFPATLTGTYFGYPTTTTTTTGDFQTPYCVDGDVLRLESDPPSLAGLYLRQ